MVPTDMPGEVSSSPTTVSRPETLEFARGIQIHAFDFCEAEVENFHLVARGDENVGGLDVAVDDALGVGGFESVGDLDRERKQLIDRKRLATHFFSKRLAFE